MSIQKIRDNSQSLLSKIIVGLIALTFAVFGLEALNGGNSGSDVASVNGEQVGDRELLRATELMKNRMIAQMGGNVDIDSIDESIVKTEALKGLINSELLLQNAIHQGLVASNRQIDSNIINTSAFQIDGVFNRQMYEEMLRRADYMPRDYMTQIEKDLQVQQALYGINQSAFITRVEIERITKLDRQQRNIAYLTVTASELVSIDDVSDSDVENIYIKQPEQYLTEETVSIQYLELRQSDFIDQVEVSNSELEQQYKQEVESYKLREERNAAHILVDTDERSMAEARNIMDKVQTELAAGGSFATLAKQYSDDIGSAKSGGELGYTERGAFEKSFETALFALDVDQISDVIETASGYTIIKLLNIRDQQAPPFAELKEQLITDIKYQKAEELFVIAEEQLSNDSFSSSDLDEPADNLGLIIKETELFSKLGGSDVISSNQKIVRTAFSKEVLLDGMNSELITINKDHIVVIRLKEHKLAQVKPFNEVADEIRQSIVNKLAGQKATEKATQLLDELRSGATPEKIAASSSYKWTIVDDIKRNQDDMPADFIDKVFKMPKPDIGGKTIADFVKANGDVQIIALTKVYDGDTQDITEQDIKSLQRFLAQQIGNFDYLEYQNMLSQSANIEIY